MPSSPTLALKRVYEPAESSDGKRVLVERLWPRGLSKERAHVDLWLKDIAPTAQLRTWYSHDPARYAEFRRRYEAELSAPPASGALAELRELAGHEKITLVVGTHDLELSTAPIIRDALQAG